MPDGILLQVCQCHRCQHIWVPRRKLNCRPRICPKCKSKLWGFEKANKRLT